jgi:hypothetical protein
MRSAAGVLSSSAVSQYDLLDELKGPATLDHRVAAAGRHIEKESIESLPGPNRPRSSVQRLPFAPSLSFALHSPCRANPLTCRLPTATAAGLPSMDRTGPLHCSQVDPSDDRRCILSGIRCRRIGTERTLVRLALPVQMHRPMPPPRLVPSWRHCPFSGLFGILPKAP